MALFPADYVEGEEWIPLIPLNNAPFADYDTEAERLTPELFAQRWNPTRMQHAASEKHTFRKMKREQAMLRKFVEVNSRSGANLIIVDADLPDAREWVEELITRGELPYYAFLIENPENGHCHVGWFIEGCCSTRKQKDALLVLRNAFGGKVEPQPEAYAFWGMRNPLWASARVFWGTAYEYSFGALFAYVPDEVAEGERERLAVKRARYGKEQPLNPDSSHRFTDLRDECRGFLYGKQGRADFAEWATEYCLARNTEFSKPLPEREVRSMAKNIIRFILNRMDAPSPQSRAAKRKKLLSTEAFSAEQRAASLSRPVVAQAAVRHQEVLELMEQGYTAKDIGRHFNVKPAAARQWMTRARKWAEKQTQQKVA